MAASPHTDPTEVALSASNGSQIDTVRLAALLSRLEVHQGGVCAVAGCSHEHAPGDGHDVGLAAPAMAA